MYRKSETHTHTANRPRSNNNNKSNSFGWDAISSATTTAVTATSGSLARSLIQQPNQSIHAHRKNALLNVFNVDVLPCLLPFIHTKHKEFLSHSKCVLMFCSATHTRNINENTSGDCDECEYACRSCMSMCVYDGTSWWNSVAQPRMCCVCRQRQTHTHTYGQATTTISAHEPYERFSIMAWVLTSRNTTLTAEWISKRRN